MVPPSELSTGDGVEAEDEVAVLVENEELESEKDIALVVHLVAVAHRLVRKVQARVEVAEPTPPVTMAARPLAPT